MTEPVTERSAETPDRLRDLLAALAATAAAVPAGGGTMMADDPDFRRRLSRLGIEIDAAEATAMRAEQEGSAVLEQMAVTAITSCGVVLAELRLQLLGPFAAVPDQSAADGANAGAIAPLGGVGSVGNLAERVVNEEAARSTLLRLLFEDEDSRGPGTDTRPARA